MKKLSDKIKTSMNPKQSKTLNRRYHFTYDVKDCNKHFGGDSNKARRFILCVLKNSTAIDISRSCETTLIITYKSIQPKLFPYLKKNLEKYFYYSVSLIAKNGETNHEYFEINSNESLEESIKAEWKDLTCDDFRKYITTY